MRTSTAFRALPRSKRRHAIALLACGLAVLVTGCESGSEPYGSVSTSMSVGVGYGYYGPGWYGGYYEPYPPVVVVPPGERPDRPPGEGGGNRPTTLPSQAGGGPSVSPSSMAPSRPSSMERSTSRPSPRPAPRSMPRRR
jgi:hypothetical protein